MLHVFRMGCRAQESVREGYMVVEERRVQEVAFGLRCRTLLRVILLLGRMDSSKGYPLGRANHVGRAVRNWISAAFHGTTQLSRGCCAFTLREKKDTFTDFVIVQDLRRIRNGSSILLTIAFRCRLTVRHNSYV